MEEMKKESVLNFDYIWTALTSLVLEDIFGIYVKKSPDTRNTSFPSLFFEWLNGLKRICSSTTLLRKLVGYFQAQFVRLSAQFLGSLWNFLRLFFWPTVL